MSSRYIYTTMDRVFSSLTRAGIKDFDEDDIIEWTGEALEFMASVKSYEEDVCFKKVVNHQCSIPKWSHAIIQIARDNQACNDGVSIIALTKTTTEEIVEVNTPLDVETTDMMIIADYISEEVTPAKAVSLNINYKVWIESPLYRARYTPVNLKSHSFFNSVVCQEKSNGLYDNCTDEYNIIMGNVLRFSFEEGIVAIAHLKQAMDKDTGWPLIPDSISHIKAIVKYIQLQIADREFQQNREGSKGKLDKNEADWQWYCKQASNIDIMPNGVDEYQNLLNQSSYLLPRNNKYFGFFGNLNKPEDRKWNKTRSYRNY